MNWRLIIAVIIFAVVVVDFYYWFETEEMAEESARTLDVDGFCCFKDGGRLDDGRLDGGRLDDGRLYAGQSDEGRLYAGQRDSKGREEERRKTLSYLPPDYEFLDYEYVIHSAALSTFHRDVTSSQVLYGCEYPVYTLIVYEYEGDLLSVCPASERTWPFVWSRIVNLSGPKGTCVLFNSEILHAGLPNQCRPRLARQYKICHREDIKKLAHLQGVRATKNTECVDDAVSRMKRKISYYFAFLINHMLYPFLMQKWESNTWMGQMQAWLPDHQFYNNI